MRETIRWNSNLERATPSRTGGPGGPAGTARGTSVYPLEHLAISRSVETCFEARSHFSSS